MSYRKKFLGRYAQAVNNYLKFVEFILAKYKIFYQKCIAIAKEIPEYSSKNIFKITLVIFIIVFAIFMAS